jgi:hypothetical protein
MNGSRNTPPERAIDDTREAACERQERSVSIVSWLLVADVHDGDCGFWSLAPSGFGMLFRSGESSGPDWTVAATAPGSYLLPSCYYAQCSTQRQNRLTPRFGSSTDVARD